MPRPSVCPDGPSLQRFLLGQMPEPEAEEMEQHVQHCSSCGAALEALKSHDTLTESIRNQGTVPDGTEQGVVDGLVQRLKELRLPAVPPAMEATEAAIPAVPQAADQTCEVYDFLAPPQGPGEIGRLGSYRVLKVLGTGGMGVVFQAEDVKLKRLVALKAMRPATAASAGAGLRFQREAEATAAIKHDHIVTIYQVGEDRGVPFLAMEFLEGMSLDDWLKKGRTPTLTQAARIGRQIALGLAEAHACGLIHRDIKPGNVWLDSRHQGRVKLLDFGLARGGADDDHQLTQSGAIVGTPAYMAPEQARGEKVDHRVDLFSLGVVLYRLTTGQLPFRGDNTMSVLTSLAMDTPKAPRAINPDISPRMAALIERLLCKDRSQRPATAKDVAVELAAIEREATQPATAERTVVGAASVSAPVVSSARSRLRLRKYIVAASLFLLLGGALAAIVIRIKTPNGEIKEMRFPEGTTVEVVQEKDGPFVPKGAGPLDRLDPAKIPAIERFADMPKELVAVLGENRGGHVIRVNSLAFSPDGKLAASTGEGRGVGIHLWDVATMREKAVIYPGTTKVVFQVAFAPDGKTLAAGCDNYMDKITLQFWDVTGAEPKKRGDFNAGVIRSLAFSSDGRRILTGGARKNDQKKDVVEADMRLWDVETGKEIRRFEGHTDGHVESVALSPNGRRALSCGFHDKSLRLWDVDSGKELKRRNGHFARGATFSPDGKRALVYCQYFGLVLWDVEAWKQLAVYRHIVGIPYQYPFSPDGRHTIVAVHNPPDSRVGLLDLESGQVREFSSPRMPGNLMTSALSADGRRALCADGDNAVRLWDVDSGKELLPRTGHTGPVLTCAFSPDGKTLASGGIDGTVRLWNLTEPGSKERAVLPGGEGGRGSLAFTPDGKSLALATPGNNNGVQVWDLSEPQPKLRWRLATRDGWPGNNQDQVLFTPDGKTLVAHMGGGRRGGPSHLWIWDLSAEEPKLRASVAGKGYDSLYNITRLVFTPDGKSVVSGLSNGGDIGVWDVSGEKMKQLISFAAQKKGTMVALAPDGKTLASIGADKGVVTVEDVLQIKLWDLSAQPPKQLALLGSDKLAWDWSHGNVQFAPDGKTLVTQNAAGHFILWDVATRKKLRSWQLPAECSPFAFAPDGRHLAVGSKKGAIFILRLDVAKP